MTELYWCVDIMVVCLVYSNVSVCTVVFSYVKFKHSGPEISINRVCDISTE